MDLRNPYEERDMYEKFRLGGKINASLLSLKHLNYLDLSNNDFYSIQVPNFFGELKSLHYLNLSSASFGGEIPPSLGNLSSLNFLDLGWNIGLTSRNLNWLSRLSSLKYLDLGSVDLSTTGVNWVYAVNMLPSLAELLLSFCRIEIIPLISLRHINLTSLLVLDVSDNMFSSSFPSWLFNLTSLITLDISGNHFNGNFPEVIGNLCKLKVLSLSQNEFKGGIEEFWRSFSNCPNIALQSLDLSYCELESQLPASLGLFKSLQKLDLESNLFFGPIPSNIDQMMPNLDALLLSENHFTGIIPPSVCNMQQLGVLSLRSNQFYGELPRAWNVGSKLWFLDVGLNNLSGNIPTSLGVLSSLQVLKLNNNNFGGEIPDSLRNCSILRSLDLGDNKLYGNIPLWIGGPNVSVLYRIQLRSNSFSGHLSQQLCNLRHLHILDLSHNNLSGTIPKCLDNLASLVDDLNADTIGAIEQITLTLKGRELVYNKTINLVKSIDLSSNNLQGEIPEEISSLIQFGQIPQSLSSLTFLNHLNLSYNNLSGRIPSENQLQTLNDSSIYMENPSLCGVPLSTKCPGDDIFPSKDTKDMNEGGNDALWFYVSMVLGFIVGFWGVCGTLILKTSWRSYATVNKVSAVENTAALKAGLKSMEKQKGILCSLAANANVGRRALADVSNVKSNSSWIVGGDASKKMSGKSERITGQRSISQLVCIFRDFLSNCLQQEKLQVKDLIIISSETYTRVQVLGMEKAFLKKPKFRLNAPIPYVFMLRFLKAAQSETKLEHLAFYLIELCLVEYEPLRFKPSWLCAAALYVARCTLQITPAWTPLLCKHTRYEVSQIRDGLKISQSCKSGKFEGHIRMLCCVARVYVMISLTEVKTLDISKLIFDSITGLSALKCARNWLVRDAVS
ncbi:hypothetical protein ACFX14_035921 [Malus domestica]